MDSEEIRRLIDEGWAFRIKESHGKRYITRRKGGKERSVARYNEDIWNQINELTGGKLKQIKAPSSVTRNEYEILKMTLSSLESSIRTLSDRIVGLESKIDQLESWSNQAKLKTTKCIHILPDEGRNFCSEYAWEKGKMPKGLTKIFPRVFFTRIELEGFDGWRFSPHPDICGPCTRFMEKLNFNYYLKEELFVAVPSLRPLESDD